MRSRHFLIALGILVLLLVSCSPAPEVRSSYDPASLRFEGERAHAMLGEFVTRFVNRHSGAPNNRFATDFLKTHFEANGWSCYFDEWEIINYSRLVPLRNLVCLLPGESEQEILVVAHHDQFAGTVQGADNDGTGIAILMHLAEIFAEETPLNYTLVFVSTDAEEYGMIGAGRYIQTHPDLKMVLAGISLDQLGKEFYDGLNMFATGQYRDHGRLWLQLTAQAAARAAGDLWVPNISGLLDQLSQQAVPISGMDQGPIVAAGVPAFGFAGRCPPERSLRCLATFHSPLDNMDVQDAGVLHQSGRVTEATLRQLLSMQAFPNESGPYLYFESSHQVVRGAPLWLIFIGFVTAFFAGSYFTGGPGWRSKLEQWRRALPHLLSLWLPLVASVLLLYLLVAVGLMDKYHRYPGTSKDPVWFNPRWPAVILFLIGLWAFLSLGRRLLRRYRAEATPYGYAQTKSLSLLIVGLAGLYILALNPFSLLLILPTLFWFLIGDRRGWIRAVDVALLLLGGAVFYFLLYSLAAFRGLGLYALWFMMMMFSVRMVSFTSMAVATAVVAAGLSLIVRPAGKRGAPYGS